MEGVIVGQKASELQVKNVNTGELIKQFSVTGGSRADHYSHYALYVNEETVLFGTLDRQKYPYNSYIIEYDLKNSRVLRKHLYGSREIWCFTKPSNLDVVSVCSWDGSCELLSYSNFEKKIAMIDHDRYCIHSEFIQERNEFVSVALDEYVKRYSLEKNKVIEEVKMGVEVRHVQYQKRNQRLVVVTNNGVHSLGVNDFGEKHTLADKKSGHSLGGHDFYCSKFHSDGNLLAISGFDVLCCYDVRKPKEIVHGGNVKGIGECWRMQNVNNHGEEKFIVAHRYGCQVRDWNWKVKTQWKTQDYFTDSCAYRGDQLDFRMGFMERQAVEDTKERINYLTDNFDEFEFFKVSLTGNDFVCLRVLL